MPKNTHAKKRAGKPDSGKPQIYDFIVIGTGIAGLMCAIYASKKWSVLIITKKNLKDCNTWYAQGGIAAVLSKKDSYSKHIKDTLRAGHYHNNRKAVEFIIKNAPKAIKELERLGVKFSKKDGKLDLKLEGGHSEKRIAYYKDEIGKSVEKALVNCVRKNGNITVLENAFAADLLVDTGRKTCYGVRIIKGGQTKNYFGRRTVLATGGAGQVYKKTTNPKIAMGDGIAMAHRAGCKITDMEFIQFHPTALDRGRAPQFLLSETLRGDGALIINKKNERFMVKAHPMAELAPRDVLSRVILIQKNAFLDLKGISLKTLKAKYPNILAKLKELKINPKTRLIPITPVAHYVCGGIKIDLKGGTGIRGLYAAGECARTGLHGANRLASNSLLEAAVLSSQITKDPLPEKIESGIPILFFYGTGKVARLNLEQKIALRKMQKQIQTIMWEKVGIIRTRKGLHEAMNHLKKTEAKFKKISKVSKNNRQVIRTLNLLTTAKLITKAAITRKKSLGCHIIEKSK